MNDIRKHDDLQRSVYIEKSSRHVNAHEMTCDYRKCRRKMRCHSNVKLFGFEQCQCITTSRINCLRTFLENEFPREKVVSGMNREWKIFIEDCFQTSIELMSVLRCVKWLMRMEDKRVLSRIKTWEKISFGGRSTVENTSYFDPCSRSCYRHPNIVFSVFDHFSN